eukprot:Gb_41442 [translate_table: standard]
MKNSFGENAKAEKKLPSVSTWWKTTEMYKDASNNVLLNKVLLGKQKLDESYSLGNSLKRTHIEALVNEAVTSNALPKDDNDVYLVLTSDDVEVERLCTNSCGFHAITNEKELNIPYAWVGNSATQCLGQCAWPFHQPLYGPQSATLVAPNGDVGIDGMVINIATVLVGAVTNPFNIGHYQGDAVAPLEVVSACPGIYGKGAYPGYPGQLLVDATT